jgi:hypothetical protein
MAMLFIWILLYLAAMYKPEVIARDTGQLDALQRTMDSVQLAYLGQQRSLRRYNPNYLTDYEAYLCGFSALAIRRIRKFRETGGVFRSLNELSELLEWTPDHAEARNERLYFPSKRKASERNNKRLKVDLNTASEEELQELRGIGPVLSARIVRFRERLRGFRDKNQLFDIYGIRKEVAGRLLETHLICSSPADSSRIRLSTSPPSVLRGFPYFSERQVDRILQYRESHDGQIEVDDLKVLFDLSQEKFNRIKLYLH